MSFNFRVFTYRPSLADRMQSHGRNFSPSEKAARHVMASIDATSLAVESGRVLCLGLPSRLLLVRQNQQGHGITHLTETRP